MGLADALKDPNKKTAIIDDALKLVDAEVASKSGISGFAVKKGYDAVKSIKPGFVREAVERLLPDMAVKVEPIWDEGTKSGQPRAHLEKNRGAVADALLSVTDAKVEHAKSGLVKSTYKMLRGSAKKNVEEAVPRLGGLLEKYAG
ncbi:MAG: hypothetical protein IPM79_36565 [Polyangiaceae bacterium]|jgi:hypothetical protein|nr:hypothetical protein [Polyangiaceae bacterium]MBK8942968.1 hypothetical protein [Polyangiaceae bacterium]